VATEFLDDENVEVRHFSSWAMALFRSAGGVAPAHPTSAWWDETLAEGALDAVGATGYAVDAVIVDEGQDFGPSWWLPLEMLLRGEDDGTFIVFADQHQEIYRDNWVPPFERDPYHLTVNCRNTLPIAKRVAAVFGDALQTRGEEGPEPEFHPAADAAEVESSLGSVIRDLCGTEGAMEPGDIIILVPKRSWIERLAFRRIGGQKINEPGGIRLDTIHSFKGLESKCVIALFPPGDGTPDNLRYVAMSRAKAHLVVIGDEVTE
jgi:superfamily I DNA/RNA helicase